MSRIALAVSEISGVPVPGHSADEEIALFSEMLRNLRENDPAAFARVKVRIGKYVETFANVGKERRNILSEIDDDMVRGEEDGKGKRRRN